MKLLYKFYWNCGRMGDLNAVFTAEKEDIDNIMGKNIYFGEVLGKHSEIGGFLGQEDLEVVTDDVIFIEQFEKYELATGYNPLDYVINEDGSFKNVS